MRLECRPLEHPRTPTLVAPRNGSPNRLPALCLKGQWPSWRHLLCMPATNPSISASGQMSPPMAPHSIRGLKTQKLVIIFIHLNISLSAPTRWSSSHWDDHILVSVWWCWSGVYCIVCMQHTRLGNKILSRHSGCVEVGSLVIRYSCVSSHSLS